MESANGVVKHLAFIIIFLLHAILLIALSFMTFKAITTLTNKKSNPASVSFNPEELECDPENKETEKEVESIASNIKSEEIKPEKVDLGNKKEIKPELIKPNVENKTIELSKPKEQAITSDVKSSVPRMHSVNAKPKMSGKDFLKQAVNVYDNYRYNSVKDQSVDNLGDDSKSRHARVLQERVAYWNDYAYLEALDDALIDEANKYKDYYVYTSEDVDDVFPIEFSVAADGTLHSIDELTGIKEVDDHLTKIIKKTKYPVNKKCKIYKYKTKIRVCLGKGLNPIKITKPRYWN